jgi:murein DD-endopeptidase MepM/ murein hydrolase activator NlpD
MSRILRSKSHLLRSRFARGRIAGTFVTLVVSLLYAVTGQAQALANGDLTVTLFNAAVSRPTGKPQTLTQTFSLPPSVHGPFKLFVVNGDANAQGRVSSASITLNGVALLGPSDFNQKVSTLELDISLSTTNTVAVELRGEPGAYLKISVTGQVSPNAVTGASSGTFTNLGGKLTLPESGLELNVPSGAVDFANIQLATVSSPLMDFLAAQAGGDFQLLDLPKVQITSSAPLNQMIGFKMPIPNLQARLPLGQTIVFVALVRTSSPDEPQMLDVTQIGGVVCGDNDAACVFVVPGLFDRPDPLNPQERVLQLALASKEAPTSPAAIAPAARATDRATIVVGPTALQSPAALSAPLPSTALWQLSNVLPAPRDDVIQLSPADSFSLSADFQFRTLRFAQLLTNPLPPAPACKPTEISLGYTCISSSFGLRSDPVTGNLSCHYGVDLATRVITRQSPVFGEARAGFPIYSAEAGTATFSPSIGGGNQVLISHPDLLGTSYSHLEAALGTFPESVSRGMLIGLSGNTGAHTTAPHLHFGMSINGVKMDAAPLLRDDLSLYFPFRFCLGIDGTMAGCSIDLAQAMASINIAIQPTQLAQFMDGQPHTVSLLLTPSVSSGFCAPALGNTHVLQTWRVEVLPQLSITKVGTGTGTVVSSPTGISCGSLCSNSFSPNSPVRLIAIADDGSTFSGWSGDCTGLDSTTTVVMTGNKQCVAAFSENSNFTVNLALLGDGSGKITSSPQGIDCGGGGTRCSASFPKGTELTLVAAPTFARSFLESWSGCPGPSAVSGSTGGSCAFTVNSNANIAASFFAFRVTTISETCIGRTAQGTYEVTGAVGDRIWPGGHPAPFPTISCGEWTGPISYFFDSDPQSGQYCLREAGQPRTTIFQDTELGGQRFGGQTLVELIDKLGTGAFFITASTRSRVCFP